MIILNTADRNLAEGKSQFRVVNINFICEKCVVISRGVGARYRLAIAKPIP